MATWFVVFQPLLNNPVLYNHDDDRPRETAGSIAQAPMAAPAPGGAPHGSSFSGGYVALTVILSLAVVALILFVVARRRGKRRRQQRKAEAEAAEVVDVEAPKLAHD